MKTSLDHLAEHKRAELGRIVETIRAEVPAAGMVILFGSHAHGEQVRDVVTGYRSDDDLLVIVDGERVVQDGTLWARVNRLAREHTTDTAVDLLVHDFREVNAQIRRARFFFVEIGEQGIALWDSRRFQLAWPKAGTQAERKAPAQEYFDHWFASAGTFFKNHAYTCTLGDLKIAAFLLHQPTERSFAAMLLAFTGTRPVTHKLDELVAAVAPLHPLLAVPFPLTSEEERRLFDLLRRVRRREVQQERPEHAGGAGGAGERVKDLAGRIEQACRESIAGMG